MMSDLDRTLLLKKLDKIGQMANARVVLLAKEQSEYTNCNI